jgi:hypothetical protein
MPSKSVLLSVSNYIVPTRTTNLFVYMLSVPEFLQHIRLRSHNTMILLHVINMLQTVTFTSNVVFRPDFHTIKVYTSKTETHITLVPEANRHLYAPTMLILYLLEWWQLDHSEERGKSLPIWNWTMFIQPEVSHSTEFTKTFLTTNTNIYSISQYKTRPVLVIKHISYEDTIKEPWQ